MSNEARLTMPNGKTVVVRIREANSYQANPENTNKGKDRGAKAIKLSLDSSGFHRGIVTAADDVVLNGNHAYKSAQDVVSNWIEVETDGSIGVSTKRTDWKTHRDPEAVRAAILDNLTQKQNFELDIDQYLEDVDFLKEFDLEIESVFITDDELAELIGDDAESSSEEGDDDLPPEDLDMVTIKIRLTHSENEEWKVIKESLGCKDDAKALLKLMQSS